MITDNGTLFDVLTGVKYFFMDSQVTGILDLTFVERPSGNFLPQVGPSWCIDRNDWSPE